MKRKFYLLAGLFGIATVFIFTACSSYRPAKHIATSNAANASADAVLAAGSWAASPVEVPDPAVTALLNKIDEATAAAQTLTADFCYAVTSVKQQQFITGKVQLMKPNFMRINYDYMAHPAFPNPVAADGEKIYTFTPQSFMPNRTFHEEPFDAVLGARQASGLLPGGGKFSSSPVNADGSNLHLWDSIALQAFFKPAVALRYLYYSRRGELKSEGQKEINGVTYDVIEHHFVNGNIAGGENSSFEQHVYVAPCGLIAMYVLEFTSQGRPGVQIMRLSNLHTNVPLTKADFTFTPPSEAAHSK